MAGFHNILVGVDLTKNQRTEDVAIDDVAANAVSQAMWLAGAPGSRLTFLSAVQETATAEDIARTVLADLVKRARAQGAEARSVVAHGQGLAAIILEVQVGGHDLVVVGTHDRHGLRRFLFGSTAASLVHRCPCPVWVSKHTKQIIPRNILVASDLSPLSDEAVLVALEVGRHAGAHTHLLDVVDFPLDRLWSPVPVDRTAEKYHGQLRRQAVQGLQAQLKRSGGGTAVEPEVTVHVADGDGIPDHAVVQFVQDHGIDLLVLGSTARHGLSGALLGNMAERLLAQVPCSVLTVKHENS